MKWQHAVALPFIKEEMLRKGLLEKYLGSHCLENKHFYSQTPMTLGGICCSKKDIAE